MKYFGALIWLLLGWVASAQLYFPPTSGNQWDTLNATQLGWCPNYLDSLDDFLINANSKSCLILKNGKLVHEKYYGTFTQDSLWYWASAGKTLTAFLLGLAQEQAALDISLPASNYLGTGWTSTSPSQELQITVQEQMQMSTGLDYRVPDLDCTQPSCLTFKDTAGSQWYYHNAPYLLLHQVLESATNKSMNAFTFQNLHASIGFSGFWSGTLYLSKARAMARFGLLLLAQGDWNGQPILNDKNFFQAMTQSSQSLNPAYGYLTWLNGKSSYIQPGLAFSFPGAMVPLAPTDMYMAAGKNDQRIYVVPSENLVVVRQGNAADSSFAALSAFDQDLWFILNQLRCTNVGLANAPLADFNIYPNPSKGMLALGIAWSSDLLLVNKVGQKVAFKRRGNSLDFTASTGCYFLIDEKQGMVKKILRE
jgi:CubicO group peptidase (beta-lactamase class C family)